MVVNVPPICLWNVPPLAQRGRLSRAGAPDVGSVLLPIDAGVRWMFLRLDGVKKKKKKPLALCQTDP